MWGASAGSARRPVFQTQHRYRTDMNGWQRDLFFIQKTEILIFPGKKYFFGWLRMMRDFFVIVYLQKPIIIHPPTFLPCVHPCEVPLFLFFHIAKKGEGVFSLFFSFLRVKIQEF